jgi:hypothetical protein
MLSDNILSGIIQLSADNFKLSDNMLLNNKLSDNIMIWADNILCDNFKLSLRTRCQITCTQMLVYDNPEAMILSDNITLADNCYLFYVIIYCIVVW